jgi:hypothetical protein
MQKPKPKKKRLYVRFAGKVKGPRDLSTRKGISDS